MDKRNKYKFILHANLETNINFQRYKVLRNILSLIRRLDTKSEEGLVT